METRLSVVERGSLEGGKPLENSLHLHHRHVNSLPAVALVLVGDGVVVGVFVVNVVVVVVVVVVVSFIGDVLTVVFSILRPFPTSVGGEKVFVAMFRRVPPLPGEREVEGRLFVDRDVHVILVVGVEVIVVVTYIISPPFFLFLFFLFFSFLLLFLPSIRLSFILV